MVQKNKYKEWQFRIHLNQKSPDLDLALFIIIREVYFLREYLPSALRTLSPEGFDRGTQELVQALQVWAKD